MRPKTRCSLIVAALVCFPVLVLSAAAAPEQKADLKNYALIFGTVYSPDNRPVHGAKVTIRPVDGKKPKYDLVSDRRGEFAQRLPVGRRDFSVRVVFKSNRNKVLRAEKVVRIENDERVDIGLHLTEQ